MENIASAAPTVVPINLDIDIMPLADPPLSRGPDVKSKKLFGV